MWGNSIFTNVALTDDGDVWWEGLTDEPPAHLIHWKGRDWTPDSSSGGAPQLRFTTPADQCPIIAPEWEDPTGVPISAILFGGRRASTVPLVIESFDWDDGVFLGSNIASEKTAAARQGRRAAARPVRDAAVLRLQHGRLLRDWLKIGRTADPPAAAAVLRQLVPQGRGRQVRVAGFGENIRVPKWIIERLSGDAKATATRSVISRPQARWTSTAYMSAGLTWPCCLRWTPRPGSWKPSTSPSSSGPSTSTCPPASGTCTRTSSTASANDLHRPGMGSPPPRRWLLDRPGVSQRTRPAHRA